MNLLCDIQDFKKNNISFLETKKNMVIDGFFTKLIYTDANISLNGLYIHFPIKWINEDKTNKNQSFPSPSSQFPPGILEPQKFDMFSRQKKIVVSFVIDENSSNIIDDFIRMEYEIIEYYREFFKVNKPGVYSLKNQLKLEKTVLWYTCSSSSSSNQDDILSKPLILKISGVWETQTNIGITYKFHI